jgi:hypothetical protein
MNEEIDIFKCLDYIRDNAKKYAQAKANRVYLEEYRRSLKANLMAKHVGEAVNAQEREALCHNDYIQLLSGLKAAIEEEENLRWKLIAAQAKISVWQTLSANERMERKIV